MCNQDLDQIFNRTISTITNLDKLLCIEFHRSKPPGAIINGHASLADERQSPHNYISDRTLRQAHEGRNNNHLHFFFLHLPRNDRSADIRAIKQLQAIQF